MSLLRTDRQLFIYYYYTCTSEFLTHPKPHGYPSQSLMDKIQQASCHVSAKNRQTVIYILLLYLVQLLQGTLVLIEQRSSLFRNHHVTF